MDEWPREKLFILAGYVEQYPCLWKRSDPDYKKRNRRQYALNCIAQNMSCSMEKIDRKLKIILTQFFREVKKENTLTASNRRYKSKWFLYPALEYLKEAGHKNIDGSETEDSVNAVIVSLDDTEDLRNEENGESSRCYESLNNEDISVFESNMQEEKLEYLDNNSVSDAFQKVSFRKRPSNHKKLIYVARNFNQSECKDQDECDIFGSFVSKKMKKLNEINRSVVQMEITQILFNKEMEQKGMVVETAPAQKITLNASESPSAQ